MDKRRVPALGAPVTMDADVAMSVDCFLKVLRGWPPEQRHLALLRVFDGCLPDELSVFIQHVQYELSEKRDFTAFFPDELICEVFSYLNYKHICICSEVNSKWRRIANDQILWKRLSFREFGVALSKPSPVLRQMLSTDWKSNFRMMQRITPLNECAGWYHSAFVADGGKLFVCGNNERESVMLDMPHNAVTPRKVQELANYPVGNVSVNYTHFAVVAGGCVFTWGLGDNGQLGHGDKYSSGVPKLLESIASRHMTMVSAGRSHTCAVSGDGLLFTWGSNSSGQLGLGSPDFDVTAPQVVPALQGMRVVTCSADAHTVAVTDTGSVFSWGNGQFGCLGHGDTNSLRSPKLVGRLRGKRIVSVCAGFEHTFALTAQGSVYSWGHGSYGRLGHGDERTLHSPKMLMFRHTVTCISTRIFHSALVTERGAVYTFGQGSYHQLGHGGAEDQHAPKLVSALSKRRIVSVSCGGAHTVAIDQTGAAFTWGYGGGGRCGHPDVTNRDVERPRPIRSLKGKLVFGLSMLPPPDSHA